MERIYEFNHQGITCVALYINQWLLTIENGHDFVIFFRLSQDLMIF